MKSVSKKIKLCHNCTKKSSLKKGIVNKDNAKWKKKIGIRTKYPKDIFMPLKVKYPKKVDTIYNLTLSKMYANRYIYYYAAQSKNIDKILDPQYAAQAYGKDFTNRGVARINNQGEATIKLECPQSYYVESGKQHVSHIHYLISNPDNKGWKQKLYTRRIICEISKKDLKVLVDNRKAVIINALPYHEYIKQRIPNSIPLPYDILTKNKIDKDHLHKYLKEMLSHYPKIDKLVKTGKYQLQNIPIVVYCYHNKCNASKLLIDKLVDHGYTNLREYSEGILGWFNRNK